MTAGRSAPRAGRAGRPLRARAAGAALLAALTLAGCGTAGYGAPVAPASMSISSEAFVSGMLAQRYTCHGAKTNPPLNWSGAPAGTKSLALIVDDSSAPITPTIYWLVFDINPGATDIQEGALPTGARQAANVRTNARHAARSGGERRTENPKASTVASDASAIFRNASKGMSATTVSSGPFCEQLAMNW